MIFDKFIWRFADWCLNIPLLEMASERNEKMSKIESKNRTINEHLFKWFLQFKLASTYENIWTFQTDLHVTVKK